MEKKVTVLTPNGRRQLVKVNPNTTLLQILEEVCLKHSFDSDEYSLTHHNKEMSLTQMFRFSGLPNNCLLEMNKMERKRMTTQVDICVQSEDGVREQGTFVPSDTLWDVLTVLCPEASVSYKYPVVIYTRQEIFGKQKLTETTLKSLGIIEGRALMRFLNKKPEELKTQANVYIAPVVKETVKDYDNENNARGNSGGGRSGGFAITKDVMQSLKKESDSKTAITPNEEQKKDNNDLPKRESERVKYDWGSGKGHTIKPSNVDVTEDSQSQNMDDMEIEPEINIIGERNAIIFSVDNTSKQMEDIPDSFFDLTVHDLKLVLRDLKKISDGNEDAPLLTAKLRELEENKLMLNKIAQYKNCVIRIKFSDTFVLQGMFKPIDKISNVMDFVRKFLNNPDAPFHLFTIPPKRVLPLDKTLLELDFVPTALLYFAYDDDMKSSNEDNFIKKEFLEKLTSVEGALYAANKFRITTRKVSTSEDESNYKDENARNTKTATEYIPKPPGPSTGAIPKRPRSNNGSNI